MALLKNVFSLLTCVLLAGCVLQSEKPIYGEGDGKLVLKPLGQMFVLEMFDKGQWTAEDSALVFKSVGRHYRVTNGKDNKTADVLFVDVGHGMSILQFSEPGKAATYVLAQMQKSAVMMRPLMCSDLKKGAVQSALVTYKDSDCVLKAKPGAADIKAWDEALGEAKMRLRVLK